VGFVATAPSKPFTSTDAISLFIALLPIITVCLSFAWDGLVRRRVLLAGYIPLGIRAKALVSVTGLSLSCLPGCVATPGPVWDPRCCTWTSMRGSQ
jgi:hypothetical protein